MIGNALDLVDDDWLNPKPAPKTEIEKLNDHFAVIAIKGKVRILGWDKSPIHKDVLVPAFFQKRDFELMHANRFVTLTKPNEEGKKESKRHPLTKLWLADRNRVTYRGVTFDASTTDRFVGGAFNLWRGFSVQPARGDWHLMKRHIREVLAGGDRKASRYIAWWTAWAFQNPATAAEVALTFRGLKGTGKGAFAREVCTIFGAHGVHVSDRRHVIGNFNAHFMQCSLLYSDEALWPGDKQSEGALKRLITEPTLAIEPKGLDLFDVPNRLHMIMTGNDKWIVPASGDERRYAVFGVSDERRGDRAYFTALMDEIKNGGTAAMLYDLLALDLKGWHPRDDVPETIALGEQKMLSAPAELKWLGGVLEDATIPRAHLRLLNRATGRDLFEHARRSHPSMRFSSDHELADLLKAHGVTRKLSHGSWWKFPPLKEMRAAWQVKYPWWRPAFQPDGAWLTWFEADMCLDTSETNPDAY